MRIMMTVMRVQSMICVTNMATMMLIVTTVALLRATWR